MSKPAPATNDDDLRTLLADPELVHALATLIRRARIHVASGALTLTAEHTLTNHEPTPTKDPDHA